MMDTAYFLALFFIFLRVTASFAITNIFFPNGIPKTLKAVFSLIFSFALFEGIDHSNINSITSSYYLTIYMISEVTIGLVLGLISNIAFEVVLMAESLIDVHIGLGVVNTIDPNSRTGTTISGNLLHYVTLMILFVVDEHRMLIKSLIESFIILPMGRGLAHTDTIMVLIEVIIKYFVMGLRITIPIVLIIILADLYMGLISRAIPRINVMILGMPVKMLVGILAIPVSLPIIIELFVISINCLPDIFRKIMTTVPLIFLIGADGKTEEATPKKKSDSRKKGQIARSKDIGPAVAMIATVLVVAALGGFIVLSLKDNVVHFLGDMGSMEVTESGIKGIDTLIISKAAMVIMPVILPIMIAGVAANLVQSGLLVVKDAIKPSFGKLNPINGFKSMLSKKSLIELIKNSILTTIVIFIAYSYIRDNSDRIIQIGNLYLPALGVEVKSLIVDIFVEICMLLAVTAIIDYAVRYTPLQRDIRMTKQEIKEEYKQMEGDPQIKSRIKQRQREMSQRRMVQSVGDAIVVITNPTHSAAAIKYEEGKTRAPKVVAKGADTIAIKVKEKTTESKVPIIENKSLARMIFESVEINKEIPQDMYQVVAEVLAMVYKLDKEKRRIR